MSNEWIGAALLGAAAGVLGLALLARRGPKRRVYVPKRDGSYWERTAVPESEEIENREAETLARILVSETKDATERVAVGFCALNKAQWEGKTLYEVATRGKGYGAQEGRPFSTRQDGATAMKAALAIMAMPAEDDPTYGAIWCFEPELQDKWFAAGKVTRSAAQARAKQKARGFRLRARVGRWEFWGDDKLGTIATV